MSGKALSAKRLRELLCEHRVHNSYNLCRDFNPADAKVLIWYRLQQTGLDFRSAAWQVIQLGHETDSGGYWGDYGHKTFTIFRREERQPQLKAARSWASMRFGVDEWVKDPFGNYQTAETVAAMLRVIREQVASPDSGAA